MYTAILYGIFSALMSRLSFLPQDPRTLELILKPREAQRIIDFDTFSKGF